MQTTRILSHAQIAQLIGELAAIPDEPIGEHLSDEDNAAYIMESCTPEQQQRIDRHLVSCLDCVEHLEYLYERAPLSRTVLSQQHAKAVDTIPLAAQVTKRAAPKPIIWAGEQLQGFALMATDAWQTTAFSQYSALAKSQAPTPVDGILVYDETGESLAYSQTRTEDGGLLIKFSTKDTYRGKKLVLRVGGSFRREIVMDSFGKELYGTLTLEAKDMPLDAAEWQLEWGDG